MSPETPSPVPGGVGPDTDTRCDGEALSGDAGHPEWRPSWAVVGTSMHFPRLTPDEARQWDAHRVANLRAQRAAAGGDPP